MKRACVLILLVVFCIIGFLSIWGNLPFTAVSGSGMAPELRSGELIVIDQVAPDAIKEGDIVVYNVPDYLRERYGYPPVIAHRVADIISEESGLWLRTQADNIGDDPFPVRPHEVRGTVTGNIPYLGYPLLLFRGGAGTILFIIAIILLAFIMYSREIAVKIGRLLRTAVAPIVEENQQVDLELSRRFEATERALKTAEALEARTELEKKLPESGLRYQEIITLKDKRQSPPGCAVNPKALLARPHS